jgi:molecular chaperone HscB
MQYFDILDLSVRIMMDAGEVRTQYLKKSRESHPDFHTLSGENDRDAALQKSTLVTNAYTTLKDVDSRLKYILTELGVLEAEEKSQLPPEFLMEMMDFNDRIMEADDDEARQEVGSDIVDLEEEIKHQYQSSINSFDEGERGDEVLQDIKDYYMKKRYLWRLRKQLREH